MSKTVQFQTIQFSISMQFKKTFLFWAIQFSQAVLIQFSISTDFVYRQLHVNTVSRSKNSSISNNSVLGQGE